LIETSEGHHEHLAGLPRRHKAEGKGEYQAQHLAVLGFP
jgi:hypothetical protein